MAFPQQLEYVSIAFERPKLEEPDKEKTSSPCGKGEAFNQLLEKALNRCVELNNLGNVRCEAEMTVHCLGRDAAGNCGALFIGELLNTDTGVRTPIDISAAELRQSEWPESA